MKKDWKYTKGLHALGNGHYAYLLPDGSWGWSTTTGSRTSTRVST